MGIPDLKHRARGPEMMDDRSITDGRLTDALRNLRVTNRWLGGYAASDAYLDPLLHRRDELRILDVGTGLGDYAAHLVRRGANRNCRVTVHALDNNPVTVGHARAWLDASLRPSLRARVEVQIADATQLNPVQDQVDVVHACLFLHHFHGEVLSDLLATLQSVSRCGVVINDLHRHAFAYVCIFVLSRMLPVSPMYRHDAPLSVRRGFRRGELERLARRAGLAGVSLEWHWAFRWVLTTLSSPSS